ncbi:hypothetical protein PMIN01_03118 [Paraphaeosphaeria minitans]|uniref:Uncharacterized protein n=1 Tax=Paraphaeosphaeria minitans TaxID=565426 RepID=A0A9P6GMR7_9PLEO|nr:hypothetical protein PMIN01_03118 [Paraphaeosphaeria minitans]
MTSTEVSSVSSVSSTKVSGSSTSSTASSSFSSSTISSSSFSSSSFYSSSMTTTFSSSMSSRSAVSFSSSSSANSTFSAGPSCPTGSELEINDDGGNNWSEDDYSSCPAGVGLSQDDDEGDNENPDAGTFCPHKSLELNDEEDFDIGDWHFENSSNIPIPDFPFKPSSTSSTSTSDPVGPSLPHHTTSKIVEGPTLQTSANRPHETSHVTLTPSSTPVPVDKTEYTCTEMRSYGGPKAKKNCQEDEYCKSFEWLGPLDKDPMQRAPTPQNVVANWNGWERTCERYKETPDSYYCKSCTRNPAVCKIIRDYTKNNWSPAKEKAPIEECWADEMCESDRTHTRICHHRNPSDLGQPVYQPWAAVFCMECPRNSPVERNSKGCMAQMDFKNDGRQDLQGKDNGKNLHDCPSHCISDAYAHRYCSGTQCWSCPFKFLGA